MKQKENQSRLLYYLFLTVVKGNTELIQLWLVLLVKVHTSSKLLFSSSTSQPGHVAGLLE